MAVPSPAPVAPSAPAASAPPPAPASSGASSTSEAPPPLTIAIGAVDVKVQSFRFDDRSVQPFYRGQVTDFDAKATAVAWPEGRAHDLAIRAKGPDGTPVWILGTVDPKESWLEANLAPLRLPPFNPYTTSYLGYVVRDGSGAVYAKISRGPKGIFSKNWIELKDLSVGGEEGAAAFQDAFGIPLGAALALLRDPSGTIGIDIPIDIDPQGAVNVHVGKVVQSALRAALIGALTSPLKAFGALVPSGGGASALAPGPLHCAPGSDTIATDDKTQLEGLARLLAERPGLRVSLRGLTTPADVQGLQTRALLAALESGDGLPADAEGITRIAKRRTIRLALTARLAGEDGPLDPGDEDILTAWRTSYEIGPPALEKLATTRAENIRALLESRFGIAADRSEIGAAEHAETGTPGVAIALVS